MGKQFEKLSSENIDFIKLQKLFFIASCSGKEVNLSPRGYDCFRVLNNNEAVFLDYHGSGNRTATDIINDGEVTVVFCSFDSNPLILRLFCKGEVLQIQDSVYNTLFQNMDGARQLIKLNIYCVEQSCGMSVPYYEFKGERNTLKNWCIDNQNSEVLQKFSHKYNTPPNLANFRTVIAH